VTSLWEQTKATTNGRAGLAAFLVELAFMLAGAALFCIAMVVGAVTLAVIAGACTLVLALLTPAVTAYAQGYRRAPDVDAVLGTAGGIWHVTARRWEVGDSVTLDHRRCRLRSCVQRADRPFALPRRAVYFFTADPAHAHVLGNVARSRARYVYRLTDPTTDGDVFSRGIAVAVTGDVRAVIAERHEWGE
jgi:hypothetical protein